MEVPSHLLSSLGALGKLNDDGFGQILGAAKALARGSSTTLAPVAQASIHDLDPGGEMQEALVALYLHTSTEGSGAEALASGLVGLMSDLRARAVAKALVHDHGSMRTALEAAGGMGIAQLIDVNWERSSVAAWKQQPRAGGTLYVVNLTTRAPDGTEAKVHFSADAEQLADLVAELKGAMRQVEVETA